MAGIIQILIGQCGIRCGIKLWNMMREEHALDQDLTGQQTADKMHLERISTYFQEKQTRKNYETRAIVVDMDANMVEEAHAFGRGYLFPSHKLVSGKKGAYRNWARGYHGEGEELMDEFQDTLRLHVEECDSLQGFQIVHSVAGGTGGGLGSLILGKLQDDYSECTLDTMSVFPSNDSMKLWSKERPTDSYNSTLTLSHLMDSAHTVYVFDTEAVNNISRRALHRQYLSEPWNRVISSAISGLTVGLRSPGDVTYNMSRIYRDMVPIPRFKFLSSSLYPRTREDNLANFDTSLDDAHGEVFIDSNVMTYCKASRGRTVASKVFYRGDFHRKDLRLSVGRAKNKERIEYVQGLQKLTTVSLHSLPPAQMQRSVSFLTNNMAVQDLFNRIHASFTYMLINKTYLQWYHREGLEEDELTEAYNKLVDIQWEYTRASKTPKELNVVPSLTWDKKGSGRMTPTAGKEMDARRPSRKGRRQRGFSSDVLDEPLKEKPECEEECEEEDL